ncbi:MAG: hypothetical protein U0103_11560 [Candidatus Obscuribacterales bacterium]
MAACANLHALAGDKHFSAYSFAARFANDAYDEIMLNSADSIVARILKQIKD